MEYFTADALAGLAEAEGLVYPSYLLSEVVAALDVGKHVMLTGSPGTGKTSLAFLAAQLARQAVLSAGHLAVTASSDWGIGETIGRYDTGPEGAVFQPGFFLQAVLAGEWLVIDELNRADFDAAFGPLFTVLANQAVTLPFKQAGHSHPISIVPTRAEAPPNTDPIRLPSSWRMVATMNEFDKSTLHRLSYALMRRFAIIEVESPPTSVIRSLLKGPGEIIADLLAVRTFVDMGPAIFLDAAKFAERRAMDCDTTRSRILFETFYSYLLPQLDRLDDRQARDLFDVLAPLFDAPELLNLGRVLRRVLGTEMSVGQVVPTERAAARSIDSPAIAAHYRPARSRFVPMMAAE
jgi:energy-coupling factor transporter ATP-binding protein EcfA2